jgi:hypothetical protein
MLDKLRNEPVLVRAAIGAAITLLVQFGVPITDGQANAITALAWALLAMSARGKVTPV